MDKQQQQQTRKMKRSKRQRLDARGQPSAASQGEVVLNSQAHWRPLQNRWGRDARPHRNNGEPAASASAAAAAAAAAQTSLRHRQPLNSCSSCLVSGSRRGQDGGAPAGHHPAQGLCRQCQMHRRSAEALRLDYPNHRQQTGRSSLALRSQISSPAAFLPQSEYSASSSATSTPPFAGYPGSSSAFFQPAGFMHFSATNPVRYPFAPYGGFPSSADGYTPKQRTTAGHPPPPPPPPPPGLESASFRKAAVRAKAPQAAAPVPTPAYLAQSCLPATRTAMAQPLLVILDINGTLIHRKHRRLPPKFVKRPGLDFFLEQLTRDYTVMVWSSSQPPTVQAICPLLFPKDKMAAAGLAAAWGRDKFNLPKAQYHEKVQVYKQLETVWADETIQARYPGGSSTSTGSGDGSGDGSASSLARRWNQSNTVLIDDSRLKALSEPYNLIQVPEFTGAASAPGETHVLADVLAKLYALARCDDVSKMLYSWSQKTPCLSLPMEIAAAAAAVAGQTALDTKSARKARKKAKMAVRQAERVGGSSAPSTLQPSPPSATTAATATKANGLPRTSGGGDTFLLDRLEESL